MLDILIQPGGIERNLGRYGDTLQNRSHHRLAMNGDGECGSMRDSENCHGLGKQQPVREKGHMAIRCNTAKAWTKRIGIKLILLDHSEYKVYLRGPVFGEVR